MSMNAFKRLVTIINMGGPQTPLQNLVMQRCLASIQASLEKGNPNTEIELANLQDEHAKLEIERDELLTQMELMRKELRGLRTKVTKLEGKTEPKE